MVVEMIGKWLSSQLLGYALGKVKKAFRPSPMIMAFERACDKVVKEEEEIFDPRTLKALNYPSQINLADFLKESFGKDDFDSNYSECHRPNLDCHAFGSV